MKANRKFITADEAVSPVIGVILMVAITVVLAAVVFVLVSDLGGDSEAAPNITFKKDETNDRITVVRADPEASWARIAISEDDGTNVIVYDINADVTAGGGVLADGTVLASTAAPATAISAGDYIDLCDDTSGTAAANVKISVLDVSANAILAEFTFSTIVENVACM